MPRIARVVAPGIPHHITQRGNYRQNIFLDDTDRVRYLTWLREDSEKYGLKIIAYCLMHNHVHYIAIPEREDSLAKTFNAVNMKYSQYLNKKMKNTGHLWQGRYYSCILDAVHLLTAARYVERNPARANIVKKPWHWEWSSARANAFREESKFLKLSSLFDYVNMSPESWREFIDNKEDETEVKSIRKHTRSGRPFAVDAFVGELEGILGRSLRVGPRGRPRKNKANGVMYMPQEVETAGV